MTYKRKHLKGQRREFRPSIRMSREEWEVVKVAAYDLEMSVPEWMVYKAEKEFAVLSFKLKNYYGQKMLKEKKSQKQR